MGHALALGFMVNPCRYLWDLWDVIYGGLGQVLGTAGSFFWGGMVGAADTHSRNL